jgi:DNA polymerase
VEANNRSRSASNSSSDHEIICRFAQNFSICGVQFPQALETVLETLERMRAEGEHRPCASRAMLAQLEKVGAVAPNGPQVSARVGPTKLMGHDSACPSKGQNAGKLAAVNERVCACVKCPNLASSRTQTVFGVGSADADLMFVGEAPGADEDAQGEPFVGRAGQLLTRIIKAMGFAREEVYIANILKCRPDTPGSAYGNRPPTPSEMQTCRPYLMEQIGIIQPKVIVALGATAVEGLLGNRAPMHQLRGRWNSFNGTPLMVTYHPAYLLRNQSPSEKRKVWEDMMQVLERLEKPISEKQRNYFL